MKKIEEKEALDLLKSDYKGITIDNEYNVCDYYDITQLVIIYKKNKPDENFVVEFYNKNIRGCCDNTSPHDFEDENDISCDNVYYYLFD